MPDTHGWIWPKDPRPGNPAHWPRRWRLFDVFTNKGPDIFVGRISVTDAKGKKGKKDKKGKKSKKTGEAQDEVQPGPLPMTTWSRWENDHDSTNDTATTTTKKKKKEPFPWARRNSAERYDFRTKRYCIPDSGTWSRVVYCSGDDKHGRRKRHVIPMRYWDREGNEYPAGYWHDVVYGGHEGCCDRGGAVIV